MIVTNFLNQPREEKQWFFNIGQYMLVTEYERVGLVVLLVSKFVATILRSPPRDSSQYMPNVGKIK